MGRSATGKKINIMRIRSFLYYLIVKKGVILIVSMQECECILKAHFIYWWCHIMYTLGTMCQSPVRIYSLICTLKPSLQSLPLRSTRFCGLSTAMTVHSAINKLCVVGDGTHKAARNTEWGHVDKIRVVPCRLFAAAVVREVPTHNTGGVDTY